MPKKIGPDMKRFMDKKVRLSLNAKRVVSGKMRGFDQFMNIVLDEAFEERSETEGFEIGTVVRSLPFQSLKYYYTHTHTHYRLFEEIVFFKWNY